MNEQDIEILEATTKSVLASWWSQLNRFEWPDDLPNPEPSEYIRNGRRSEIMRWISERIGVKECLRDWNKKGMTDEEFEAWWKDGRL